MRQYILITEDKPLGGVYKAKTLQSMLDWIADKKIKSWCLLPVEAPAKAKRKPPKH